MKTTFSTEELSKFRDSVLRLDNDFLKMFRALNSLQLNEEAKDFALYGFLRRCKTLKRCIHKIYELCPPDSDLMEDDKRNDTEIYLQTFIINVYGAIDNLANILNLQFNYQLPKSQIGFLPILKFENFIGKLSNPIKEKLNEYKISEWEEYILSYRHSLAHRIPLYIPPKFVTPADSSKYIELEANWYEELGKANTKGMNDIDEEIRNITRFEPIMTHSFREDHKKMYFHAQVLADWNTVMDLSNLIIEEIKNKLVCEVSQKMCTEVHHDS